MLLIRPKLRRARGAVVAAAGGKEKGSFGDELLVSGADLLQHAPLLENSCTEKQRHGNRL